MPSRAGSTALTWWSGNRGDMDATATTERRKAAAPGGGYSARFQQAPSAPVPLEDPHGSLYASTPYLTTTAIARARSALVSDTESYPERHGAGSSLRDKQRLRRVGRPRRPILEDPFERRACQRRRTEKRIRSRRLQWSSSVALRARQCREYNGTPVKCAASESERTNRMHLLGRGGRADGRALRGCKLGAHRGIRVLCVLNWR
jgi:hypothetical protein